MMNYKVLSIKEIFLAACICRCFAAEKASGMFNKKAEGPRRPFTI